MSPSNKLNLSSLNYTLNSRLPVGAIHEFPLHGRNPFFIKTYDPIQAGNQQPGRQAGDS
jgi:hypothetical protein